MFLLPHKLRLLWLRVRSQALLSLCLIILTLLIGESPGRAAVGSPDTDWKVISTPHFEVIHNKNHIAVAKQYAEYAERARHMLEPYFSELPDRMTILMADTTDQANGFARFLPYPFITVYPALPTSLSSLESFSSWGEILVLHEYVHALQMQPSNGFYTPFKYIFGQLVTPTALLPRWYLEGMAVEFESRLTGFGRLHSSSYGANLRAMVEGDLFKNETLDRLNESSDPSWPYGARPYFLGSLLFHEAMERGGVETADKLLQRYSRRVPFFLDGPAEEHLGAGYSQLLSDLYERYQAKAEEQIAKIKAEGSGQGEPLKWSGRIQINPSVSPNGKYLAYFATNDEYKGELRLVEKAEGSFRGAKSKRLRPIKGNLRISWHPSGKGFVYDQISPYRRHYYYRDLYYYDLEQQQSQRITKGERAYEASFSTNGDRLVYVKNVVGGTELWLMSWPQEQAQRIYQPQPGVRLSTPVFVGKDQVAFSMRNLEGEEHIYRLEVGGEGNEPVRMLKGYPQAKQLVMTPEGLIFSSTQSGTANFYLSDRKLQSARAITNVTTQVMNGALDQTNSELYFSQLTAQGPKLFVGSGLSSESPPHLEPVVDPLPRPRQKADIEVKLKEKDYAASRYMLPRYWVPFLYPVTGGLLLQGITEVSDPVEQHRLAAQVGFDTITQRPSYALAYMNSMTSVDYDLLYSERNEPLSVNSDSVLTFRTASLGSGFYLTESERWRTGLSFNYHENTFANSEVQKVFYRQGPRVFLKYSSLSVDRPESHEDVSENGWAASLSHTHYLDVGKFLPYDQSTLGLSGFTSSWLPARHSLSLNMKGTLAPELPLGLVSLLGDTTVGGNYLASLINSSYLMRGYPSGNFRGRKMLNANLEYHFPVVEIYKGRGLWPLFLKELTAAVFVDAVSVDGLYFTPSGAAYLSEDFAKAFYSAGMEFHLQTTTAYHLPIRFTLGLYYGFDEEAGGGLSPFLGIGVTGLDGFD